MSPTDNQGKNLLTLRRVIFSRVLPALNGFGWTTANELPVLLQIDPTDIAEKIKKIIG